MFEQKNAVKTEKTIKELLKIQSKRLKILNDNFNDLEKERKRTYKEMLYFKNQCKKKTNKIKKAIEFGNGLLLGEATFEERHIANRFLNILKGDSDGN